MDQTELGQKAVEDCMLDPKLSWSSEGDLGHSMNLNTIVFMGSKTMGKCRGNPSFLIPFLSISNHVKLSCKELNK